MEFIRYKQSVEQSANNMLKYFIDQIEDREIFYKKLIEKKEEEYQKFTSIKDNEIAVLSECKRQLELENRQLKEALEQIKVNSTEVTRVGDEQAKAILPIDEEDYQQLIDDIQKAYIIESQRIIEYCLDDLLKYCEGYEGYIQIDDFWSIVFVAYTCNRHREIYEVYANRLSPNQHKCHEHELYMKLLELSSAHVEEANFEVVKKHIRDTSKDMVNIYPYIKNELLDEISEIVEQMYQDFFILEENKGYQHSEQEEDDMNSTKLLEIEESLSELVKELNKTYDSNQEEEVDIAKVKHEDQEQSIKEIVKELLDTCEEEKQTKLELSNKDKELYSIPQINKAIKKYVGAAEWKKLQGALRYVIKHHNYYQQLFDSETFAQYLLLSHTCEYEDVFCEKFATTKERLMQVSEPYNLHCMLEAEKNMPLYTLQANCANRAISQSISKNEIFKIADSQKILARLKKNTVPLISKLTVMETLEKVLGDSRNTWEKSKVFLRIPGGKMFLIEAWRKNDKGAWFITTETYKNITPKMAKKQIKFIGNLQPIGIQSANTDNMVGEVNYSKTGSIDNGSKDTNTGEIPLNEKSPLKVLGYDTTKSKDERWQILTQQAIPKLGKEKVIWYINFFIKFHRSKPTMASAIKEWEYDLRRLGAK